MKLRVIVVAIVALDIALGIWSWQSIRAVQPRPSPYQTAPAIAAEPTPMSTIAYSAPPTSIPFDDRPQRETVPPDPRTGPFPTCWVKGPIPGQSCPSKPPHWSPPPR